jgi:glycosyltransferase involved in cell wall biosynthesis
MTSDKLLCSVSFVVPALNEEAIIESTTRECAATIDGLLHDYEIILVDDGSSDRTGDIMDRLARELPRVRVLHNRPNMGLGAAYWRGVGAARLDYVMMLCGDGAMPAASLPAIIAKIGTADIVIPNIVNLKALKTPFRYFASRAYTELLNIFSGHRIKYYNGLPVHRRALLNQITDVNSGFGYSAEIIIKLLRSGCNFVEVDVPAREVKGRSTALKFKNLISVAVTMIKLAIDINRASTIKMDVAKREISPARERMSDQSL